MGYKAIIAGSTGLVGGHLLEQLLVGDMYDEVVSLVRPSSGTPGRPLHKDQPDHLTAENPKLQNHEVDLMDRSTYGEFVSGDHLFICTGTTRHKTPNDREYFKIEHDLPLGLARAAVANGVDTVVAISAIGADPESRYQYLNGKGKMERDIAALGLRHTYFIRPALISGKRREQRKMEGMLKTVQKALNPLLIGPLKKYKSIHPALIASAMIEIACHGYTDPIVTSDVLRELGKA